MFISRHSFSKKNWETFNLCFLVEFRFLAVSGWSWATHSHTQSVKLLIHSRPKIEFYLFAIAYLPTLFPPTQLFFFFFFFLPFQELFLFFFLFFFFFFFFFCCITHFLAEIPKLYFFIYLFIFFFLQEKEKKKFPTYLPTP